LLAIFLHANFQRFFLERSAMKSVLLRISVVLLAAGASNASAQDSRTLHSNDITSCKSRLASGELRSRVAFAQCVNRVNKKWWIADRAAHFDVLEYAASRELVAAQQFDAGKLTEIEYQSYRAKIKTDLRSEIARRDAAATPPVVHVTPQYRAPVNCYPAGRTVTCF
jgi:hypothetical protein